MIPERFMSYRGLIPIVEEVAEWSLLRKWSLSEVYRIKLKTGESRILKWGGEEMSREADIYRTLLQPLQIRAPIVYGFYEKDRSGIMLMEDAGTHNLEQRPEPAHFLEAARELAKFRATASMNLDRLSKPTIAAHTLNSDRFLKLADDLLRAPKLAEQTVLWKIKEMLSRQLDKVIRKVPPTLVHHDYHAKNLLIQGNRILPIDWSIAYINAHLGDLYCLIMEAASWSRLPGEDVMQAYREEVGNGLSMEELSWQIRIGGLCWLVKSLRWLVYGGTEAIPGSEKWIPDLLEDAGKLLQN
jgi:tRNA A-37 threonylcarbamoyl transferase component Bud32